VRYGCLKISRCGEDCIRIGKQGSTWENSVATQDRVVPYYAPNSSIKQNKSDSKDSSQEIL
jgi:hypothetical protein